jgi:hypothetical protein
LFDDRHHFTDCNIEHEDLDILKEAVTGNISGKDSNASKSNAVD